MDSPDFKTHGFTIGLCRHKPELKLVHIAYFINFPLKGGDVMIVSL